MSWRDYRSLTMSTHFGNNELQDMQFTSKNMTKTNGFLNCNGIDFMTLTYIKPTPISLKEHPQFNEAWLQERIAEEPSILGLGELDVLKKELKLLGAGRLDLLLTDSESETWYGGSWGYTTLSGINPEGDTILLCGGLDLPWGGVDGCWAGRTSRMGNGLTRGLRPVFS